MPELKMTHSRCRMRRYHIDTSSALATTTDFWLSSKVALERISLICPQTNQPWACQSPNSTFFAELAFGTFQRLASQPRF
jgi:hypothetical protein